MWPDRVSNPGPLALESDSYRLRYAAHSGVMMVLVFTLATVSSVIRLNLNLSEFKSKNNINVQDSSLNQAGAM